MAKTLRKKRNAKPKGITRKQSKDTYHKRVNVRAIRDEALKERFDKRKTFKQNLENTDVKEMYSSRLPDKIPEIPKHLPKVNEEDVPIIKTLVAKHGDDYAAMHWDIKVNEFQWTDGICKKKVLAWKAGREVSAAGEIFSGHGVDFRKPIFGAAKERNVFGH